MSRKQALQVCVRSKKSRLSWQCCYMEFGDKNRGTVSGWLMFPMCKQNGILSTKKITSQNYPSQFLP